MTTWNYGHVHDLLEPGSPQERLGTRLRKGIESMLQKISKSARSKFTARSKVAGGFVCITRFIKNTTSTPISGADQRNSGRGSQNRNIS